LSLAQSTESKRGRRLLPFVLLALFLCCGGLLDLPPDGTLVGAESVRGTLFALRSPAD
jgi:hypothetical protein